MRLGGASSGRQQQDNAMPLGWAMTDPTYLRQLPRYTVIEKKKDKKKHKNDIKKKEEIN